MVNRMFERIICKVTVRANETVSAYDQYGLEIPFFSGPQLQAMKRIKARIERQKPCYIKWCAEEGARFVQVEGPECVVFYNVDSIQIVGKHETEVTKP